MKPSWIVSFLLIAVACGEELGEGPDAGDASEPAPCTEGTRRCSGDGLAVQECGADGSWTDTQTCSPNEGLGCSAGECVAFASLPECQASAAEQSYLGCEHWAVSLANPYADTSPFSIAIANPHPRPVTFIVDGGGLAQSLVREVAANDLATLDLPWVTAISNKYLASTKVSKGAYRVRANAPVTVYQFNPLDPVSSNDASMLLPRHALTGNYRIVTTSAPTAEFPSLLSVVGLATDPTTVTIVPKVAISAGTGIPATAAGTPLVLTLAAGEVAQLVASTPAGDLTGTRVTADRPVSVFAGNVCTSVLETACDHLEEQALPIETWGKQYAVTPFFAGDTIPFVVKIAAGSAGATVTFNPATAHAPITLGANAIASFTATTGFIVNATQPVLVAEFISGRDVGGADPSMVYAVPVEQFRSTSTFLTAPSWPKNFVSIVGPSGKPPTVDGTITTATEQTLGSSGLSHWRVPLSGGVHNVGDPNGMIGYGATVYGFSAAGSYGYVGGLDQRIINTIL